jgi:ribosomal protein S18 acetylase RimI-like enzyme
LTSLDPEAARTVAGALALLSREIREAGPPANLWSPDLSPDLIRDVAGRVGRGGAVPLWVEEGRPARGLAVYAPSAWESDFFGYGCARVLGPFLAAEDQRDREARVRRLARQAADRARAQGHRLVTAKIFHDPAVLRGFLAEGFVLAEIGAALAGTVPGEEAPAAPPAGFRFLEREDLPDLAEEIADALGDFCYDGHYRHDPEPGPETARRLWSPAAREDLGGRADPAVALWDIEKGRAAGLAAVRLAGQEAVLSILAVSAPYRGRGLGRLLLRESLNRLRGRAARLRAETASYNLPALKLYQRLGLTPVAPLAALHLHL